MNIAIISNATIGLYSFRRELIELLAKTHKVTIVSSGSERKEAFEEMGCSFIEVPVDRHGTNPIKEFKLVKTYEKKQV